MRFLLFAILALTIGCNRNIQQSQEHPTPPQQQRQWPDWIVRQHPEWISDPNKRPSWLWDQGPPWLTDSFEFQNHCNLPHRVSKEPLLPDGRGYRALVLVYPHQHIKVRFSHKKKVDWAESLRFDSVTFTNTSDGKVMEWVDATALLGC